MTTKTQVQRVLSLLKAGRTITSAQSRTYNISRLSARIYDLREEGFNIVSIPYKNKNGNSAVKYMLKNK